MARPKEFPVEKLVRLKEGMADEINSFRFRQQFKTEADAIRELIRLGLEAAKSKEKSS